MEILNEFWTVYGSFWGPKVFDNEQEALEVYDEVCKDNWSTVPFVTKTQVIRRRGDASFK